ncbi:MAG TPA: HAD-IA family hydrolase [Anaerolineae bacterium]|jgi:putative hydrolase of the HAD superfamily|nr:HAD-IA family hydrolase [Anaerolineae bacterium]
MNRPVSVMGYKAVFFDAGNTLLRPYPSVEQVCAEVFGRSGYEIETQALEEAIAAGDRFYEERYWQDDTFWSSEEESAALWIELYTLVAERVGINGDGRRLAKEIYDEFGSHHRWQLFPDVQSTLQELKDMDVRIGVVSNWDSRLSDLCAGIGITEYLDFVMCSAVVGRMKPQPDIFHMALGRAGVSPEETLHVGDHYYADVIGARGVGITPVLIDRTDQVDKADCTTIGDLRSLVGIVQRSRER